MRLRLIIPPNPYLGDDKRNAPLGLLYIASTLEKNGFNVGISDLRGTDYLESSKKIESAEIYGITSATPDYPIVKVIAETIKSRDPGAEIILGGIHATSVPDSIDPIFDRVVVGEGELAILKVLDDFENGIKNRFYREKHISCLDDIPFPAYNLIPFDSAFSKNAFEVGGAPAASVLASRGCPFSCSFCASRKMWPGKTRFRSIENVISEIDWLKTDYGIKNLRFQDDTMTYNSDYLNDLCNKLKPLNMRWRSATRVDSVSEEILKTMKLAGCEEISFGIESLCQNALNKMGKRVEIKQFYTAMDLAKKAQLKTRLYFVLGLPGETTGFADRLIEFAERTSPEGIDVSTLVPYPGTGIYHRPERYGIKLKSEKFEKYNMTLGLREGEIDRPFTFIHDVLSEEQLQEERIKALNYVKSRKMIRNF